MPLAGNTFPELISGSSARVRNGPAASVTYRTTSAIWARSHHNRPQACARNRSRSRVARDCEYGPLPWLVPASPYSATQTFSAPPHVPSLPPEVVENQRLDLRRVAEPSKPKTTLFKNLYLWLWYLAQFGYTPLRFCSAAHYVRGNIVTDRTVIPRDHRWTEEPFQICRERNDRLVQWVERFGRCEVCLPRASRPKLGRSVEQRSLFAGARLRGEGAARHARSGDRIHEIIQCFAKPRHDGLVVVV